MKKIGLLLFVALFWIASAAFAEGLKVGEKAPDFMLKDSTGKEYTLESPEFKGKVLYICYADPDEKDANNHVEDALKKEKESGALDKTRYEGFGIVNMKATGLPNFVIKAAIKSKKKKTGAIIILDYDQSILKSWGLKDDSSDIVILDKERICRFINYGKLPEDKLPAMIQIIKEYQEK
jgi:predicted transcriptional regulator